MILKRFHKKLLRIWQVILMFATIFFFLNRDLISYGINQLEGQLHVIANTRELSNVLNDRNISDSVKEKLKISNGSSRTVLKRVHTNIISYNHL